MKFKRVIAVVLVVTMTSMCAGCSWVFMDRAPKDYKNRYEIECIGTEYANNDLAIALVSLGLIAAAWSYAGYQHSKGQDTIETAVLAYGLSITLSPLVLINGLSAATGYGWAKNCKETKKKHAEWLSNLPPHEIEVLKQKKIEDDRQELKKRCKRMYTSCFYYTYPSAWSHYLSTCLEVESTKTINDAVIRWVKRLLEAKRSVNESDIHGWTPLHYAAYTGNEKLLKYLLENGADPALRDKNDRTALYIAAYRGNNNVVLLLRNASGGAK